MNENIDSIPRYLSNLLNLLITFVPSGPSALSYEKHPFLFHSHFGSAI